MQTNSLSIKNVAPELKMNNGKIEEIDKKEIRDAFRLKNATKGYPGNFAFVLKT